MPGRVTCMEARGPVTQEVDPNMNTICKHVRNALLVASASILTLTAFSPVDGARSTGEAGRTCPGGHRHPPAGGYRDQLST